MEFQKIHSKYINPIWEDEDINLVSDGVVLENNLNSNGALFSGINNVLDSVFATSVEPDYLTANSVVLGTDLSSTSALLAGTNSVLDAVFASSVEPDYLSANNVVLGTDLSSTRALLEGTNNVLADVFASSVEPDYLTASSVVLGTNLSSTSAFMAGTNNILDGVFAASAEPDHLMANSVVMGTNLSSASALLAGTNNVLDDVFACSVEPDYLTTSGVVLGTDLTSTSALPDGTINLHNDSSYHFKPGAFIKSDYNSVIVSNDTVLENGWSTLLRPSFLSDDLLPSGLSIVDYEDNGLLTAYEPYRIYGGLDADTLEALETTVVSAMKKFKDYSPIQRYSLGFEKKENVTIINILIVQGNINGDNHHFGDNNFFLSE